MSGKVPAQTTAKMVIASAKRLMELRQVCLNSSRIAEISVPAWPIPIHQTKLMIAKPHAPGMVTPQMPTPLSNSQVMPMTTPVAMPRADDQPEKPAERRVRRQHDARDLLRDRLEACGPGAMTAYSPVIGIDHRDRALHSGVVKRTFGSHLCQLRLIRVDNAGRVGRTGAEVQVRQHRVVTFGPAFNHRRPCCLRIVQVAEDDRSQLGMPAGMPSRFRRRLMGRFSLSASIFTASMRWMQ